MRASDRLEQRNELLIVLSQIDSDINENWKQKDGDPLAELISIRQSIVRELNALGFEAPELEFNERNTDSESGTGCTAGCTDCDCDVLGYSVVARRRIGPAS